MGAARGIAILLVTWVAMEAPAAAAPDSRIPDTVQFQRAAPHGQVAAAGLGRRRLEGTVRTERHFNLVGLR